MPQPINYVPALQHSETYNTDHRTGLAASTTDLGGGNTAAGKVGLDINIAAIGGSVSVANVISTGNSTTTPLLAGANFTGSWDDVSGYASIDILGITDQNSAASGALIQFSTDGVNVDKQIAGTVLANIPASYTFHPEGRYFRLNYTNGGSNQSFFRLQTIYKVESDGPIHRPVADTINDLSLAQMTRAIQTGKDATGTYVNAPASGVSNSNNSTTTLLANAAFTGTYEDVSRYASIQIVIFADQQSATNGIAAQFSSDMVNIDHTDTFTLTDTTNAFVLGLAPRSKFFRIKYTNGTTNQGAFRLQTIFNIAGTKSAAAPIGASGLGDNSAGGLQRAVIVAKDPSGNYSNIQQELNGHKVALQALTAATKSQTDVGSVTAVRIDSGMTNRRSIGIKNLSGSTQKVYIGHDNTVSTSTGWELAAGEPLFEDVDATKQYWAIAASGTQRVCVSEVAVA